MVLLRALGLLSVLAFAVPALGHSDERDAANFSGHWTGSGRITTHNSFNGTTHGPCSLIELTIEHLPAQITIQRYHAVCANLSPDWGPHVMEVRGGKIFEDGEETGTFDGDILKT